VRRGTRPIGLVASLARPGGNVTGFSNITTELTPKRLELLSELVPQARVIALLVNPNNPYTEPMTRVAQEAAHANRKTTSAVNRSFCSAATQTPNSPEISVKASVKFERAR
jgi:ABC-type uncharacterized transport system substrate-binding protein